MSGHIVTEILDNHPRDLPRLELLVLIHLADTIHTKDRHARRARFQTSATVIAARLDSTPATIRNALATLRQRGLIVPIHDKVRPGLAQEYTLEELTPEHRDATWTRNVHVARINGHTRNPHVARNPVDNSNNEAITRNVVSQ